MARHETVREDLLREATALRQRAEFHVPGYAERVVAGYRSDGALSIYFGQDACYHFDAQLRLRRAFIDGQLFRTQGDTLARLTRVRSKSRVELRRYDLKPDELAELLEGITVRLKELHQGLSHADACVATIPPGVDFESRLKASLTALTSRRLDLAPAIRGRR